MEKKDGHSSGESRLLLSKATKNNEAVFSEQRGYDHVALGSILWSLLAFCVHIGAKEHNFPALGSIFVRAVVNSFLSALFVVTHRDAVTLPTRRQAAFLLARGVAGAIGCLCAFYAVTYMTIGSALTIFSTSPAITTVLCAVFLQEFPTWVDAVALVCSFLGVLLVTKASSVAGVGAAVAQGGNDMLGVGYAIIVPFCGAMGVTLIRYMGIRVHFIFNVLSPSLCMGVIAIALSDGNVWRHVTSNSGGLLLNVMGALCGFAGVAAVVVGLQHCRAGPAMIVRTINVPLFSLLGFLFLGERMSGATAFGMVLVVLAALLIGAQKILEGQRGTLVSAR
ncbi:unnamed protein product [Agarophyton chilense]